MPTYEIKGVQNYLHATFKSPTTASGIYHSYGYYQAAAAQAALNQGSLTQTYGTANNPYGAKVFLVAKEAGTASGGSSGVPRITITGTSWNPTTGVRTGSDSEVLVADCTTLSANVYRETTKFWLGQVTYTLSQTGDRTTYATTFNYGFAAPAIFNNRDIHLQKFAFTGRGGATDTNFNMTLLKHSATGWTFSAAAFVPGGTVLADMKTDYSTECSLASGIRFKYQKNITTAIACGTGNEGIVVRITTSANSAVDTLYLRLYYSID
jgi:hypothetical protein